MLTYTLVREKGSPLYEQIYAAIRDDILSGTLRTGEKLPSKRSLAQHLEVSVITVENAYGQLLAEGYIRSEEKKGYFVNEVDRGFTATERPGSAGKNDPGDVPKPYFMDFRTNTIDPDYFPFSVWSRIMRNTITDRKSGLMETLPFNGSEALRTAIAEHLYEFRGLSVRPEQVIIGAGSDFLYNLIIQLLGQDNLFALEDPGYRKIAQIYRANRVRYCSVALDAYGLSAERLRACGAKIVHISPSHHFPTGIVMPIRRRQELLNWAGEAEDRYIIEDDYDSEFRFSGLPIPTMQSIDRHGKVIYMNSFSKTISPSLRMSYMILPEALMKAFREKLSFYSCTVPSFEQYIMAEFIAGGYYGSHLNRMKKSYRSRRDNVIGAFRASNLCGKDDILEQDAGLHFLVRLRTELPDEQIVALAERKGIRLSFMSEYQEGERKEPHLLIVNYSGIEEDRLPEALRRLSEVLSGP